MTRSPLPVRSLADAPGAAVRIARAGGVHGIYVHNALAAGDGRGFVFGDDSEPRGVAGLCWFGCRGNLVVVTRGEVDTAAVADRIHNSTLDWRIAMGPTAIVAALRRRCLRPPLVDREQVYFRGDAASCVREVAAMDARLADRRDRDRLVQATLQLNQSDLCIEPRRIDRRWLYDTIDQRIAEGTTWVCGPPGAVTCKLDIGSNGPAGTVIEGVFTFPDVRRRGLAAGLVAACVSAQPGAVILHVAAENTVAQRAYARAGMTSAGGCRLLLSN